jgi:hypothetical protein
MTRLEFEAAVDDVMARRDAEEGFGVARARKRGRNPQWPYVPVIFTRTAAGRPDVGFESQILGNAYETRELALACAERHIATARHGFRYRLLQSNYRALRGQWGLPQEMPPC